MMGENYEASRRIEMVKKFKESGLTQTAFATQEGIAGGTLSRWLREKKPEQKFVKIATPEAKVRPSEIRIEVGGFRIYADENTSEALLKRVLREVKLV